MLALGVMKIYQFENPGKTTASFVKNTWIGEKDKISSPSVPWERVRKKLSSYIIGQNRRKSLQISSMCSTDIQNGR